jgi:hypothetical protein
MGRLKLFVLLLAAIGCSPDVAPTMRSSRSRGTNADVYLRSVADTLNDLPNALDLELLPAQPILTASTSSDGKEVRAICTENPQAPDGTFSYLHAVDGNANFATLQVQRGDIVRYYVNVDEEAAERDIEQREKLELRVRRLDTADPENALIIDGGLTGPSLVPQRIEIWRYSDKRMDAIRSMLATYVQRRQPPSGWEPSADLAALRQIVERGNQWMRNLRPSEDDWRVEPLLADVPKAVPLPEDADAAKFAAATIDAAVAPDQLRDGAFTDGEARQLEQAVWCRDIAQWARRDATSDLDAATALFDWTVRNIQLDRAQDATMIHHPWQALAYGHGTAAHRAWVFVELCRQQGIDAVVLKPASAADVDVADDENEEDQDGDESAAPLLVAALLDEGKNLYVYDPALGLPLPGEKTTVATLAELSATPELLRQLDVDADAPYPLKGDQLEHVDAFVVASPLQLAHRSARLEAALQGEDFVRLTADVRRQADMFDDISQVATVALWAQPLAALADEATIKISQRRRAAAEFQPFAERPLLWKARVLHFQGNKDVRMSEREDPLAMPREGHQDALRFYQDRTVRPSDAELAKLEPAKQVVYGTAKASASYWLGLLSFDRGNLEVAASWLGGRSLDREPTGKWASGARYNLARTHEALGKLDQAIKLLEGGPDDAPQRHGNLLRAKRLAAQAEEASDESSPSNTASGEAEDDN